MNAALARRLKKRPCRCLRKRETKRDGSVRTYIIFWVQGITGALCASTAQGPIKQEATAHSGIKDGSRSAEGKGRGVYNIASFTIGSTQTAHSHFIKYSFVILLYVMVISLLLLLLLCYDGVDGERGHGRERGGLVNCEMARRKTHG